MERVLTSESTTIRYYLRRDRRARRIRITVRDDGRCVVTIPPRASGWDARRFVQQKADWIRERKRESRRLRRVPALPKNSEEFAAAKERTHRFIENRIEALGFSQRFRFNRISVKDHRSQWGSCSFRKNLNFNYKLIFLPPRLADYVIVHEMCHLRELNHSERFWRLVASYCPDYRRRERELSQYRIRT